MSEFDNINLVENSNEDVTEQNETPSKQLEQDTSTIELLREQILLRDTANVYGESKKKQPRLKTKKSKRILASILISILAFLLIGGSGTYMFYGNKIKQAVMGDAKYFAYVESKNLKGGVNEAVDFLQFLNQNGSTKDIKPDMSTDISFTPSDFTNTSLAGMGKVLSQLGIRVTNVSSGKNTMMAIDISSKGEKIATAELINTPEQTVVRIQELSDKFINIPQEQIFTKATRNYFEGSFKTGANETKLVLSEDSKSKYITVTADKEEVKIDYSDIVINKTQMTVLGKFELTTSNNAFYANGSIDANEDGLKFDFSPKVSNNAIGQFKLDVKNLEKGSVKIPTVDPAKIVKPEEYMADNTLMEKLQQLIKKLDISQGLIPGMS